MITIEIYRRPDRVSDEELGKIAKPLPGLMSRVFHPAWAQLSDAVTRESRIRVLVHDFGPLDMNITDLDISIHAGFEYSLCGSVNSIKEDIVKEIKEIIDPIVSTRKGFPSYIIYTVELNLPCSSSQEIQSKEVVLSK